MNLAQRILSETRSGGMPFQQWVDLFKFQNILYPLGYSQTLTGDTESVQGDFGGLTIGAFKSNPIVHACMLVRMLHFSEARFQYRQLVKGRPANYFGNADLGILENPWPGATTRDLLGRMIVDVDLSGNSYTVRRGDRLARLRPDWVSILLGSRTGNPNWVPGDPDTEVIAYIYKPGGLSSNNPEQVFAPERVAHFAPVKDPVFNYKGISWLGSLIREIEADQAMTGHRLKFFEQGATVNMVIKAPPAANNRDRFMEWVRAIDDAHKGLEHAYSNMYLDSGAEVQPVGANNQQNDFKIVQGAGEVRIAVAARVPPTILGISEGLEGSTLNAGNYQVARRNLADGCLRPLWGFAAGALANLVPVQAGAFLDADLRDVAFLQEDHKDAADVRQSDGATALSLINAGYTPDSVRDAIVADDFSLLIDSGLASVQLQAKALPTGPSNGKAMLPA